jgi:protein SCO1/2
MQTFADHLRLLVSIRGLKLDLPQIVKRTITFFALMLALSGCKPRPPVAAPDPAPKTYAVRGVVQAVAPDQRHALIKHQAIPDYMAAMTMNFSARDAGVLDGISAGDEITFTLAVTETNDWIENVQRVGKTNAFGLSGPPGWHIAEPELGVGDALPDHEFTDENGKPVRFADFRGRAVVFTFFFTSCPLPDYCPRMNRNFAEARRLILAAANAPTNWQFLSVSFDASFDTPQMLSAYAKLYRGDDTNRWLFAVASTNTLASLAPKVDLSVWREGGTLSHNLRTVVLDPAGKIFRQFDGNDWTPAQLADALQAAARAPAR